MKKRFSIIIAAVLVLAICLTGCAPKLDGTETVAIMDETNIPLAEVNLMLRYQQAQMDTEYSKMLGMSTYNADVNNDDIPDGEPEKDTLVDMFFEMYVMEAEAANYGVEITAEEEAAIQEAAKAFIAANSDKKVQAALAATEADMAHLLKLITINQKMYEAISAEADTDISDEEAAQKKTTYYYFATTTTDADGKTVPMEGEDLEKVKADAKSVYEQMKDGKTMNEAGTDLNIFPYPYTYDDSTNMYPDEVKEALKDMKEGEFTDLIEVDGGYYIVRLDSNMDPEATEAKRQQIIESNKNLLFSQTMAELKEAHSFEKIDEALAKMTFHQIITLKEAE